MYFQDGKKLSYLNGEMPSRYRPTFSVQRSERITDLWRSALKKLVITYIPPSLVSILNLRKDQTLRTVNLEYRLEPGQRHAALYMLEAERLSPQDYLKDILDEALPSHWRKIHSCFPDTKPNPSPKLPHSEWSVHDNNKNNGGQIGSIEVELELKGPCTVVFFCSEGRVSLHGVFEQSTN